MWKQGRNTLKKASHIVQPALTYGSQHLQSSTKRGTRALVSLCWLSWSWHLKESPSQISHKWTLSFHLELQKSLTESPNPMLFNISKQAFPKLPSQLMNMTGVISSIVTSKDKSNSLAKQKVRTSPISMVKFYSFPVSLGGRGFHSQRPTNMKDGSKMSNNNKSASWNNKLNLEG